MSALRPIRERFEYFIDIGYREIEYRIVSSGLRRTLFAASRRLDFCACWLGGFFIVF